MPQECHPPTRLTLTRPGFTTPLTSRLVVSHSGLSRPQKQLAADWCSLASQYNSQSLVFLAHVVMSYLFSQSGSRSLNSSSLSVANASASRAQLTASLLSMGFPLTRVQPLVSLINPHNENALELALELLTRDADDEEDEDEVEDEEDVQRERDDDDGDGVRISAGLSVLMAMTGCTMAEARVALQRERDINAAADAILQQQERKDGTEAAALSDERVEKEATERQARHERWKERRRQTAEKVRKLEAEGDAAAAQYLHYGDVIVLQHVDTGDMLQADSEQQGVLLAPYSLTPSLTSPTSSSSRNPSVGSVITSPLSLSQQAHASPRNASSSPMPIIPPSLSLSSASLSHANSGRSLLSSSPGAQRKLTMPPASGVFPASAPLQTHSFSSLSSSPPQSLPNPTSPFHPLSALSPKPRSLSTPRKSSHPLSFSLPSHHRFHLTLRPAAEKDSGCGEDGDPVVSGDSVLVETYEHCYLCVEADGSIGCNRTAPITQQMVMTVRVQHTSLDDDSDDEAGDDDTASVLCINSGVTLATLDRHYVGVEDRHLTAKLLKRSTACHFSLSLAHRSANPLRSHRRASSSSSPCLLPASISAATLTTAGLVSPPLQRWLLLRRQWRLAVLACLQASISERRSELLALQRVRRVQSEDAKRLCAICIDAVCSVVLLDCGHLCACEECGRALRECVVCRQKVHRVVAIRPMQQEAR